MIDLHTHTTASDGSLSPTDLVTRAIAENIRYLAITDHDTVNGLHEARECAAGTSLTLVNGIELSASIDSRTVHILGLGIDPQHSGLLEVIESAQLRRAERGKQIGEKLEMAGLENIYADTVKLAGTDVLGRGHFAQALVERGTVKNFGKVFKRFMVPGKPGYVSSAWCPMETAVRVIRDAGGAAALAHPMRYGLSNNQVSKLVTSFSEVGGDAVEIISGQISEKEINQITALANQAKLSGSVGSDYHGPDKPWMALGKTAGLPDSCTPIWQRHPLW